MPLWKPRPDIPAPILEALKSDRYNEDLGTHLGKLPEGIKDRFSHAFSVTTLDRSPRQRLLYSRHSQEIELDPEDSAESMLGRVIHSILQDWCKPPCIAEERLGIIFPVKLGKVTHQIYLHGCADVYDPEKESIEDFKTPRAFALRYDKSSQIAQLNVLGYIWRKRGRKVSKLCNHYVLLKDYDRRKVKEGSDYPATRFPTVEAPVWTDAQCEEYITGRLVAHLLNENRKDWELDFCTDVERWVSAPSYRVLKVGDDGQPQKMAKHTATSKLEAEDKIEELASMEWDKVVAKNNELKKPKPESDLKRSQFVIEERKGSPKKCAYCNSISVCEQRRNELIDEANQSTDESEDH